MTTKPTTTKPTLEELGRRAMAAPSWRWCQGMVDLDGMVYLRPQRDGAIFVWPKSSYTEIYSKAETAGAVPDLSDRLTALGALFLAGTIVLPTDTEELVKALEAVS
jgi:hypothetical protein